MNGWKRFSLENLSMSLAGHLMLVALLITSFVLVVERAQLVAPDRVEIIEIDLSKVKVTVDETKLYNTNVPDEKPTPAPEKKSEPAQTPPPAPAERPTDSPSLMEMDSPKNTDTPADTTDTPKPDDTTATKSTTVVRVNRETVSLDRTLTISVVDALRVAMTRCWVIDTNRPDVADIRAVAHLTMANNGMVRDVWFEGAARADSDPAFAYVLDTIRAAISVCQPFKMLPPAEFSKWEKIQLTFYPSQGKVL